VVDNSVAYPRTLPSLFGIESDEVVWHRVFLLLFATWAAFNLPYFANLAPATLLKSFSDPAALMLAGLVACWVAKRNTLTALLAALLYALLCSVPRLVHPPAYAESQLAAFLGLTYTFVWSFLWLRFLSFSLLHVHRFWLALGLATAAAFALGDLLEPFILNSRFDPSQALTSFDAQRLMTELIHDLESAAVFAIVLFGGFRLFGYEIADGATLPKPATSTLSGPGTAVPVGAGITDNLAGALAYVTIIPAIVFLMMEPFKRKRFIRFHAFQCLFFTAAWTVLRVGMVFIGHIPFLDRTTVWLSPLIGLAGVVIWLILVIMAHQGRMPKLPLIGDMAEQKAGE
jgi:uncharacterized membrane protein